MRAFRATTVRIKLFKKYFYFDLFKIFMYFLCFIPVAWMALKLATQQHLSPYQIIHSLLLFLPPFSLIIHGYYYLALGIFLQVITLLAFILSYIFLGDKPTISTFAYVFLVILSNRWAITAKKEKDEEGKHYIK